MLEIAYACGDPACAEERRVVVESVEEFEQLCECGFGLVIIDIAEVQLV